MMFMFNKKNLLLLTTALFSSSYVFPLAASTVIKDTSELQDAVNTGGDYILDSDIVLDNNITDSYNRKTPIYLNGRGFTIDGNGHSRISFYSDSDSTITDTVFKNFTGGAVTTKFVGDNVSFINNSFSGNSFDYGGGLDIAAYGSIGKNAYFENNHVYSTNSAHGGALFANFYAIPIGDNPIFKNNSVQLTGSGGYGAWAQGGAIYIAESSLNNALFDGNYVLMKKNSNGKAEGGALYISESAPKFNITNSTFINNFVKVENSTNVLPQGGAIFATLMVEDMMGGSNPIKLYINAQNSGTTLFSGNYVEVDGIKKSNAIFMGHKGTLQEWMPKPENSNLYLNATSFGQIIMNDGIDGIGYNLNIIGDGSGTVFLNNSIDNADNVIIADTIVNLGEYKNATMPELNGQGNFDAKTNLSLTNSTLSLHNNYFDRINLKNYTAEGNAFLHVNVGYQNGLWNADKLTIAGDIKGETKVVIYAMNNNIENASVVFVEAPNDTIKNENAFSIYRVYGSPFMWNAIRNINGDEEGSIWYLTMNNNNPVNPDYNGDSPTPPPPPTPNPLPPSNPGNSIKTAPEVIAYRSLAAAALTQNSGISRQILSQINSRRLYCQGCGFYDYYWNGKPFHNAWVAPVYTTVSLKTPADIDADISGLEAGSDIQYDLNNRLGIFASYRQGKYDMSGKGKHFYSDIGSQIDIDSYLAGLYYRYDRKNWWTFATLYGGIQKADIKTDDGIKTNTDAKEIGASIESGYDIALPKNFSLTPSLGLFYTQLNFDDLHDNMGKTANYSLLRQYEIEAGIKLGKSFYLDDGTANIYIKPSLIQNITNDGKVYITGLGSNNTLDDKTLGRVEVGGRLQVSDRLSVYGQINHTFGDDYKATAISAGLNYAF